MKKLRFINDSTIREKSKMTKKKKKRVKEGLLTTATHLTPPPTKNGRKSKWVTGQISQHQQFLLVIIPLTSSYRSKTGRF